MLLIDNDCVIVPGFGGFMAHYKPAEYFEETGLFYPPRRVIGFNEQLQINDSLLVQSYVETYDCSYPEAIRRIDQEVGEIKQSLTSNGEYEFSGVGVISLKADNTYDFTPSLSGLISPSLFALSSFSFTELPEYSVTSAKATTATIIRLKDSSTEEKASADNEDNADDLEDENSDRTIEIKLRTIRNIAVAAIILLLLVFSSIPAGVGSNRVIKSSFVDTDLMTAFLSTNKVALSIPENLKEDTVKPVVTSNADTKAVAQQSDEDITRLDNSAAENAVKYTIVLASKVSRKGAETFVKDFASKGYESIFISEKTSTRKVVYGKYATQTEAMTALRQLRGVDEAFNPAWIDKI